MVGGAELVVGAPPTPIRTGARVPERVELGLGRLGGDGRHGHDPARSVPRSVRLSLPASVRGTRSTTSNDFGTLYDASRSLHHARRSSAEGGFAGSVTCTIAWTRWPHSSSG